MDSIHFIPLLLLITSGTGQVFEGTVFNTTILNSELQLNVVRLTLFLSVCVCVFMETLIKTKQPDGRASGEDKKFPTNFLIL